MTPHGLVAVEASPGFLAVSSQNGLQTVKNKVFNFGKAIFQGGKGRSEPISSQSGTTTKRFQLGPTCALVVVDTHTVWIAYRLRGRIQKYTAHGKYLGPLDTLRDCQELDGIVEIYGKLWCHTSEGKTKTTTTTTTTTKKKTNAISTVFFLYLFYFIQKKTLCYHPHPTFIHSFTHART